MCIRDRDYSLACRSKERKFGVRGIADGLRQSPLTTCSDQLKEVKSLGFEPVYSAKSSTNSITVTQTNNGRQSLNHVKHQVAKSDASSITRAQVKILHTSALYIYY